MRLSDLAAIWNDGGMNTLTVRRSTGTSFTQTHWAIQQGGWMSSTQWLPGDFDGDGLDDLAAAWNDGGSTSIAVYRSTRSSFAPHVQWAIRDGGWSDSVAWTVGHFDAGDRADLAAVWNDGGMNTLTVRRSTGSSFEHEHWAIRQGGWMSSTHWLAGDFDRDTTTDLAAVWNDGGQTSIAVFRSTGAQFLPHTQWAVRDGGFSEAIKWTAGDFDADGFSDIAAAWDDGGMTTLTVRRSNGTSLTPVHWAIRQGGWMDSTQFCAGRFD
jgi:hypothetical protein